MTPGEQREVWDGLDRDYLPKWRLRDGAAQENQDAPLVAVEFPVEETHARRLFGLTIAGGRLRRDDQNRIERAAWATGEHGQRRAHPVE